VQFTRHAVTDANERLQTDFVESRAAAVEHTVITIEKTIGRVNRYLQLTAVMTAKQSAKAHTVTRMAARPLSEVDLAANANTAAK
jgi:hypothetical protein